MVRWRLLPTVTRDQKVSRIAVWVANVFGFAFLSFLPFPLIFPSLFYLGSDVISNGNKQNLRNTFCDLCILVLCPVLVRPCLDSCTHSNYALTQTPKRSSIKIFLHFYNKYPCCQNTQKVFWCKMLEFGVSYQKVKSNIYLNLLIELLKYVHNTHTHTISDVHYVLSFLPKQQIIR
jgi:hypothetical protein